MNTRKKNAKSWHVKHPSGKLRRQRQMIKERARTISLIKVEEEE
tara:strand:- start:491 stop:622 length:132 start_codon:yes stop_codon:yes gene_type:complete